MTKPQFLTDLDTFSAHGVHSDSRMWPETNCAIDAWVELLHSLGCEPLAACAGIFRCGLDLDQWEFFKFSTAEIQLLFGIECHEYNLWRPLDRHIDDQLRAGNLLMFDADSFYLPDTAGVAYQLEHQKSSIIPTWIDRENERLRYFHNRTFAELSGQDYRGVLRLENSTGLSPFGEILRFDHFRTPDADQLKELSKELFQAALLRRAAGNPVEDFHRLVSADLALLESGAEVNIAHYAFATFRQLGAWAEMASSYLSWLDEHHVAAAAELLELSSDAKTAQFKLSRIAAGRTANLDSLLSSMSAHWAAAFAMLRASAGHS